MEKPSIAMHTGGGGNEPQGRQGKPPIDVENNLTCHPELRILYRVRTESETRSNANKRECERSVMNDLFSWHTFSLAQRKSMQKESKTERMSEQLCHPELDSGYGRRNITTTPETPKNIPSASCTAKRKVKGDLAPAFTLAEVFSPFYHSPRRVAFTLAEVLITLGIIGIVAAMSLPILIANHYKQETISKLKKLYSSLNNALLFAVNEYGDMKNWDFDWNYFPSVDEDNRIRLFKTYLIPYLNSVKICSKPDNNLKDCWENGSNTVAIYNNIKGEAAYQLIAVAILQDGAVCGVTAITSNGAILCDINGSKRPNRLGRDQFAFVFTPERNKLDFEYYNLMREDLVNTAKFDGNGGACVDGSKRYDGRACGALIQKDGWQIKKDYPW